MNLKEFDSNEPVCKFGPGGDFTEPWPNKPADVKWCNITASTLGFETQIRIVLPFLMTKEELLKVTLDIDEVTREVSTKHLGPIIKDILIDL
jgi:hypothetical protein